MNQFVSENAFSIFNKRDRIGVVYLDKSLQVVRSRGFLSEMMPAGSEPCTGNTLLHGKGPSILALAENETESLFFLSYAALEEGLDKEKISIRIHWSENDNIFIGWFFRVPKKIMACERAISNLKQNSDPQNKYLKIYLEQIEYLLGKLRTKNDELEIVQRELAQFTQIAAHDLRSPIRAIQNTAGWLKEDLGDDLTPDIADHIDRLERQSNRASKLVSDLLSFCQIGNKEHPLEEINCLELLSEISMSLTVTGGPKVTVKGADITLLSLRAPLDLVVRNLIDNAIKYHDLEDGQIFVRCYKNKNMCVFEIEDNGPGIQEEHQKRVFEPFEKLESYDTVPGSGLGLAQVERSVLTYGGKIKLTSPVTKCGRGSKFEVHWPFEVQSKTNKLDAEQGFAK